MKKRLLTNLNGLTMSIAVILLLSTSCADDHPFGTTKPGTHPIKYSSWIDVNKVTSDTQKSAQSRNGNNESKYSYFHAEMMQNSDMYMITAVEPRIDRELLGSDKSAEQTADSRGVQLTNDNLSKNCSQLNLTAFAYSNETYSSFADAVLANNYTKYISNGIINISQDSNDNSLVWTPKVTYYWTNDSYNLKFFGFLPTLSEYYGSSSKPESNAPYDVDTSSTPVVIYATPEDVTMQKDIMCCSSAEYLGNGSTCNYTVSMPLYHALAAVTVELGSTGFDNKCIRKVTFKNIITKGQHYIGDSDWGTYSSSRADRSITFSSNDVTKLTDANVFMFIPQTLTEANTLEVVAADITSGVEKTYQLTFTNTTLEMGKTTHFVLSATPEKIDYYIQPEVSTIYFSYNGTPAGDGDSDDSHTNLGYTRIKSYKVTTTGEGENIDTKTDDLAWTAAVTENKSIVSSFPSSRAEATAIAGAAKDDYNYQFRPVITAQTKVEKDSYDRTSLLDRASKKTLGTKDNPIDLAKYAPDGTAWNGTERYSANCYMVNYPGYYKIPVTVGSAIYADDNYGSYQLGTSGSYAIGTCTNYTDYIISSAWIAYGTTTKWDDYSYYPASNGDGKTRDSYIAWTDAPGVVNLTNNFTSKTGEEYYIHFDVTDGDLLQPCNTVIAVMNKNSKVLWSYHIWVTSYTTDSVFTAQTHPLCSFDDVKFLKVPLGYVADDYETYAARKATVVFTQDESNKTTSLELVQKYHECRPQSCCYYQWGRKDPFPGAKIYETGHLKIDDSYTLGYSEKALQGDLLSSNHTMQTVTVQKTAAPSSTDEKKKLSYGILNPNTFYTGFQYPVWHYFDLWGCTVNKVAESSYGGGLIHYTTTEAGSSTRKTVYDPCPPFLKVPPIYAFPAITYDGENHTSTYSPFKMTANTESALYNDVVNTPYKSHDEFVNSLAFKFYGNRMSDEGKKDTKSDTYAITAFGMRECSTGNLTKLGTDAYYWSNTRWASGTDAKNTRIYYLHCGYSDGGSTFAPSECNTNTYGMPVLPMIGGK